MKFGQLTRQCLLTWLAIYPVITVLLWLLGPSIGSWPLMVRTLVLTVIMVPVMVFALMPALTATLSRRLGLQAPTARPTK